MPHTVKHRLPFVRETLGGKTLYFSLSAEQSQMDLLQPDALVLAYTRLMMAFLLIQPAPQRLVMIGLGGGSLLKFCHRHLPASEITVIEINPHVIALRAQFQLPPDGPRLRLLCGDGAAFVRAAPSSVDVLLVDGFDIDGTPAALCSQRFYDDCFDALRPNGLLLLNLHSGHAEHADHLARLQRSFGEELVVLDDEDGGNSVAFACRGPSLRNFNARALRRPRQFERSGWDALAPDFRVVAAALQRLQQRQTGD